MHKADMKRLIDNNDTNLLELREQVWVNDIKSGMAIRCLLLDLKAVIPTKCNVKGRERSNAVTTVVGEW